MRMRTANFARKARSFLRSEEGASLIEYSILIGLITALVVSIVFVIATALGGRWQNLNAALV